MMKQRKKRSLAILLALMMAISLLATAPLATGSESSPVQVTEHPVGASYMLNQTAVPLSAKFYVPAGVAFTQPTDSQIKVQWYWSLTNSNENRDNGLGETIVTDWTGQTPYEHQTKYTPPTNAVGVRYYFAVLEYQVAAPAVTHIGTNVETRYAVTRPAMVEVGAAPQPQMYRFLVEKVDEDGNPLEGAVFSLDPDEAQTWGPSESYEAVSEANGLALFYVAEGAYILSEKQAPEGYTASSDEYTIWVGDVIYEVIDIRTQNFKEYETITFVNKKTPEPSRKGIDVLKVDNEGNPLAGAVIRIEGLTAAGVPRVYDETTDDDGVATYYLEDGTYTVSEFKAPEDYIASGDTHKIVVTPDGVFIDRGANDVVKYDPLIFVNYPIPTLDDDHFAYMQGYPTGDFKPSKSMTRAEAVVMFSRLLMEKMNTDDDYSEDAAFFPDVLPSDWFVHEVGYLQKLGTLTDYSRDENFRGDDPVTRAEFATLASHFATLTYTDTNEFTDVPNDHWAVKYINSAAAKGWVEGYDNGGVRTFKPEGYITRAEVVTLVNRMTDRRCDTNYVETNYDALPRTYSDIDDSHWAYWHVMEASTGHDFELDAADDEIWIGLHPLP
ncbi:MAG: S-layer homology domain-containing protein [Oscillospiraceae bacterium]|nr:S-layer homology domain-containing protein [Oscillospiraceae bacterium]